MRLTIRICLLAFMVNFLISCGGDDDASEPAPPSTMYFPNLSGTNWETVTPSQLGWNTSAIESLMDFLQNSNSKSFMVLVQKLSIIRLDLVRTT